MKPFPIVLALVLVSIATAHPTNDSPDVVHLPAPPSYPAAPAAEPAADIQSNPPPAFAAQLVPQSHDQIRLAPPGAVADFGRLKARFTPDAADPQPVSITTPDNQAIACRATLLALYDTASENCILLGQVTNSIGCVLPPHQVIYSNAFDTIRAHILYIYNPTNHSLSQDILLEESPPIPDSFKPEHTRLELWTAWFGPQPNPTHTQPLLLRPATPALPAVYASDQTADWTGAKMVPGAAFPLDTPNAKIPVARSWINLDGQLYLIETVDYLAIKPHLDALDAAAKPRSASVLSPTRRHLIHSLAASPLPTDKPRFMSSTLNVQRSTFDVQSSTFDVQSSTFDVQSSKFDVQSSKFDVQRSTFGLQPSTSGLPSDLLPLPGERAGVRASLPYLQSSTFDVQSSTFGLQSSTSPLLHSALSIPQPSKTLVLDFILISTLPLPPNAVAWWPAGGDPSDPINDNNASPIGNVSYDNGFVGQSFSLPGTDAYLNIPSSSNISPSGPFTVEAWINFSSLTGTNGSTIVAKGPDTYLPIDWALAISPSFKLRPHLSTFGVYEGVDPGYHWHYFDCATSLTSNTWYHVAMVYDGSALIGYLNGSNDSSISLTGVVHTSSYPLRIGAYAPTNGAVFKCFFNGLIDELTLYDRALAPAELLAIFNAGPAGKLNPHCIPPSTNTVAWWPADSNPFDIARTNSPALINNVDLSPGAVAQSFSFNGSNSYAEVPSSPSLEFTGPFTVEAWINYNRLTGSRGSHIAVKGPDAEEAMDWALSISPSFKLRPHLNIFGGFWYYFDCNTTLQTGAWYHVAMVYDGSAIIGYVNGTPDRSTQVQTSVTPSTYPLRIGAYAPINGTLSKCFFDGRIDELTLYDRALTAGEITALYSIGCAGKCKTDSDRDGLTDQQETFLGTDPNKSDTDSDGLTDGGEVFFYNTDPNTPDSDADGVIDQPLDLLITNPDSTLGL